MKKEKASKVFLTVEQAFDIVIQNLKHEKDKSKKGKFYVWKQRFKEGNLSHKKIAIILKEAGFHKVVEERWMPIELPPNSLESSKPPKKKQDKKKQEQQEQEEVEILILEDAFPILEEAFPI